MYLEKSELEAVAPVDTAAGHRGAVRQTRIRRAVGGVCTAWLAVAVLSVPLGGCSKEQGNQSQAAGQPHVAHAGQGKGGGRPGQGRPADPPIPIAVELARKGAIASYYTATATLAAEKDAEVMARAAGVALALGCEEGDWVEEGKTLLRIEDDEYRLRLAQAEANTAKLRDRHDRLKNMWEQNLVSAEEYEAAKNELREAEAAEGLARLDLSYTKARAPFRGKVVRRLVDVGQNITVGTPLFVISDFDPLLAIVHVPAKEFKKLKIDQAVELVLDSNGQRLKGRIKLVSPVIEPSSGTIKVTIEIPEYPSGTRPGDFAQVSIVTEQRTDRTLVPKIAVFTDRGDQVVYVAADSTAERRVVEVGFEDDENAEIISGIDAGENIVVKGQRSLKHGAPVKIMGNRSPTARRTERAGS